MKRLPAAFLLLGLFARPALAHRLDEYLQATMLSVEPEVVYGTVRLVPGTKVARSIIAGIDGDHDGTISGEEQERYARAVLGDLRLEEDGRTLEVRLESVHFPSVQQMYEGLGEIEIAFSAKLPVARGEHELTFENRHRADVSAYLVNSLVPEDRRVRLGRQTRSEDQSTYQVVFETDGVAAKGGIWWSGFEGAFRLGVRHIAEGTDHLLFLLTLLLPAPLVARAGRWSKPDSVRRCLVRMLRIVTAFTLGHSLTLALSAFGVARLPGRPVEVLIAMSILVSSVHALRPVFPGREAFVAGAFGLVHGLAFASVLNQLGLDGWYLAVSLLGFNAGIETMQLAVVAVTLPALLLLSRMKFYAGLRIAGAIVAGVAAVAWIIERAFVGPNAFGAGVERVAQHGVTLACILWGFSVVSWLARDRDASSRASEVLVG